MPYVHKQGFKPDAIAHNKTCLNNFRTMLALVSGIISGILGLSGPQGCAIFMLYGIFGSLIFTLKLGSSLKQYYSGMKTIIYSQSSGVMVYILSWVMVYNMIYILS